MLPAAIPVAAVLASLCASVSALALYEPADGNVVWGSWVDTSASASTGTGGDSPSLFNGRLGRSTGVFELSQDLPLAISQYDNSELTANLSMIEATGTNAIMFLTVYPNNGFDAYSDADVAKLAYQLANITDPSLSARRVMLRFAPEMNGNWFSYGMKPVRFIQEWKRIYNAVHAVTKRVSFVWSPNASNGYPYSASSPSNTTEANALDTDGDGSLTSSDDPFTPYWPGSDYVDWVGVSMYWKGNPSSGNPVHDNSAPPSDIWVQMVEGGGTFGGNSKYPLYTSFAKKYSKPLVMSEGAAAYALYQEPSTTLLAAGDGRVAIEQGFWRSYLNTTIFANYPLAKMFIQFEFIKVDEDSVSSNGVTRDYRITWNSTVLSAFQTDVSALSSTLLWAGAYQAGVDPLTLGGNFSSSSSTGATVGVATTTTKSAAVTVTSGALYLLAAFALCW
ncbi:hypothetical protein HDU84_000424 [Entophlyctis sp. JEL0112]|nr:hypothetical protein HDU84_000424 [Entophlyctis sp. JEL0112]